MSTQRIEFLKPRRRTPRTLPLAIVSMAMTVLLAVAVAQQGGRYGTLDRDELQDVEPVAFTGLDLQVALDRSCKVTGCDAADLATVFRAGLPHMSDQELQAAETLTQAVAAQSEDTLRRFDASGADRPALRARLVAQADADAAIAQFHAAERVRRQTETPG
jgi:hypothetical protein